MANILLTERCVRACPYCFAKKQMDESEAGYLSWENLIYLLDFLENSNHMRVSLLGGEPTLHPQFTDFTVYALERGFQVNVFTSGVMSEKKMEEAHRFLWHIPPEKFSFTCNLNHPSISSESEQKQIDNFLGKFSPLVTLGYNIYQVDFDLEFLFRKILEFNLNKHVRIGLSHPIPNERNSHVAVSDMKKMGKRFMEYYEHFERLNITPSFDCGMPLCIFEEGDLGRLYKITRNRLGFGCGPAIDIGLDMTVWACFPLSSLNRKPIFDFNSVQEINDYYRSLQDKIRAETGGIFDECDECVHRANQLCMGGCLAHFVTPYISGSKSRAPVILFPENAENE